MTKGSRLLVVFWKVAGWLLLAFWLRLLAPLWPTLLTRGLRSRAGALSAPSRWPLVSVIVPARNEGAAIERGLSSLLASDYPDFEMIAVDDRSEDSTGPVMDRLADADARMRVVHIRQLPPDWLGKNHAMHVGAQAARGEFLLFTDGDVLFEPDALRLSVAYAERKQLDHLCLTPDFIPGGYWENVLNTYFGMAFLAVTNPWLIPTPYPRAYAGVGAFNLVRRSAYDRVGGHVRIRLDVMDDVHLGKMIKYAGLRQDLLLGGPALRVRWQHSLWGVIRGLEKNGFAAFRYSVLRLVGASLMVLTVLTLPHVGAIVLRGAPAAPYMAALVVMYGTFGFCGRLFGGGWRLLPMLPVGGCLLLFSFWRSAWIALREGGIRWRDTFYPLDVLKRNQFTP
jgi:hypothetical protein